MVDDATAKVLASRYCELMNEGDLNGVLTLFADDVRFVDPLGTPPIVGREALRAHLGKAIAAHIVEVPGTPTGWVRSVRSERSERSERGGRGGRGGIVALPVSGSLDAPGGGRLRFNLISLIEFDGAGLISRVRIIAGRTDYALVEAG
jgi:steroid Delta-isomerase